MTNKKKQFIYKNCARIENIFLLWIIVAISLENQYSIECFNWNWKFSTFFWTKYVFIRWNEIKDRWAKRSLSLFFALDRWQFWMFHKIIYSFGMSFQIGFILLHWNLFCISVIKFNEILFIIFSSEFLKFKSVYHINFFCSCIHLKWNSIVLQCIYKKW